MKALTLFDMPASHKADPVTSYEAAEKFAASGKLSRHKKAVLAGLKKHNGCTSAELARFIYCDRYLPARRLPELERAEYVVKGPIRKCRVTGGNCVTWWLTSTFGPAKKIAL